MGNDSSLPVGTDTDVVVGFEPSAWLRGRLGEIVRRGAAGRLAPCAHLPESLVGGTIFLSAPGRALCLSCALSGLPGPSWQVACDRCDAVVAEWRPALLLGEFGPGVAFVLCRGCAARERS